MSAQDRYGALTCFTTAGEGSDPLRENLGLHVGDDPDTVHTRREHLARRVGAPIVWMDQTHSTEVALITRDTCPEESMPGELGPVAADGVVLDARDWQDPPALAVMTADCLPLLLLAPGVVAAVHAGRPGLLGGILERAVEVLRGIDVELAAVRAVIGPAACGRCYEIPEDMVRRAELTHPGVRSRTTWGTPALDLPGAARGQLLDLGIGEVEVDPRCTIEDPSLHSHRRDPRSGRQAGLVRTWPAACQKWQGPVGHPWACLGRHGSRGRYLGTTGTTSEENG
ncbi:laccase domain-containing protein [Schaalia sp. 19OD2882]|uniref:polyphenol oxidase family protein n=1 Tax=Schaalia sp. 19OD2882 TaxID=2794089 RepID=UPI001C1ED7B3|nr:polyphenol oxidase family protein [Schaalia sp. 19OD2882]QWW18937.1 laccase domain-containing protein [Schaalia sp. 19OD2882]